MPPPTATRKRGPAFHAALVLFTIFAIPIIISLPFLFSGFIGRM